MAVTIKLKKYNSFMEELGLPRYYEFEHQIIRGMSSRALAKLLQSEGYYKEIKLESLAANIRNFQHETIMPKIKRLQELKFATNVAKADRAFSEQRNIASALSNLIAIQQARLKKCLLIEEEKDDLLTEVTRELKLLWRIYVSVGEFQIKAGLINLSKNTVSYNNNEDFEPDTHVQEFLADIEKQRQIAIATQKALGILAKADINEFE